MVDMYGTVAGICCCPLVVLGRTLFRGVKYIILDRDRFTLYIAVLFVVVGFSLGNRYYVDDHVKVLFMMLCP